VQGRSFDSVELTSVSTNRVLHLAVGATALALGLAVAILPTPDTSTAQTPAASQLWPSAEATKTATPIKHLVVIFQENHSFDNYFGTYPDALNPPGEPVFTAAPNTPKVNGLSPKLLTANPNSANPFRLDRSQEPGAVELCPALRDE
jgi:phospholipase C